MTSRVELVVDLVLSRLEFLLNFYYVSLLSTLLQVVQVSGFALL